MIILEITPLMATRELYERNKKIAPRLLFSFITLRHPLKNKLFYCVIIRIALCV